jgi:probable phosphoglycerate mutase
MTAGDGIWLVRHAPTAWTGHRWCGRSDPPLTGEGIVAATILAADLALEVPAGAIVVTSPLRRARATADAIAAALGARLVVDPDLVEVDFGRIDGLTWDELEAAHPALAEAILTGGEPDWPGGEAAANVARRAGSAAARLADRAQAGQVVVVSHGRILRAIARELGMAWPPHLAPASALRPEPTPVA